MRRMSWVQSTDSNCRPRSVVTVDGTPNDPTAYESLGDCLRRDSSDENSFWPPCEMVVAIEEVGESIRSGERTNDVEMNNYYC